jgi:hypothetical protein
MSNDLLMTQGRKKIEQEATEVTEAEEKKVMANGDCRLANRGRISAKAEVRNPKWADLRRDDRCPMSNDQLMTQGRKKAEQEATEVMEAEGRMSAKVEGRGAK